MKADIQQAADDFAATALDAIHKLQRELRERDARIDRLERDNEALRLRLAREQETAEW